MLLPLESTLLTRARLEAIGGQSRSVILTFVNRARLDFATTWVAHVRRLGLTNWLVGATDAEALDRLLAQGVPCFDLHTNLPQGEWAWGSPQFHSLGPTKVRLIHSALEWNMQLVVTDIDALVLREPFAFMARWPDADFLTTSDHLSNTTNDDGLETQAADSAYNIGYMYFRPSALPLVREWLRVIEADPEVRWDQGEFNRLARIGRHNAAPGALLPPQPLSDPRLFRSYHGQVVGGVLPLALFCGGHSYFAARMPQRRNTEPYSVHTTFQCARLPSHNDAPT